MAALAKSVEAVKCVGRPVKDSKNESRNIKGGTNSKYRIGKLKQCHPEVAARLEAGEFKNVAEAERAAGTRPPLREKKTVTVYLDDAENCLREAIEELLPSLVLCDPESPTDALKDIFEGLKTEEKDKFFEWVNLYVNT